MKGTKRLGLVQTLIHLYVSLFTSQLTFVPALLGLVLCEFSCSDYLYLSYLRF
ncbi:hypothetical protein Hanom_Chr03g00190411 [Helianthus anomalus]